jgi:hypothetical protein
MNHNFSVEAITEIADTMHTSSAKCENKPDQRFFQQWMVELCKIGQTSSTSAA